jgi:predicted PurR-regulated permease PerM
MKLHKKKILIILLIVIACILSFYSTNIVDGIKHLLNNSKNSNIEQNLITLTDVSPFIHKINNAEDTQLPPGLTGGYGIKLFDGNGRFEKNWILSIMVNQ